VDGDGRLDLVLANQWRDSLFLHNESPRVNAFLGLRLLLPLERTEGSNVVGGLISAAGGGRPAIGATVTVERSDGRHLVAQVDGGNGHSGKRSPEILLGLGRDPGVLVGVRVRWRDPRGREREETFSLAPGWHTITLAWPDREEAR